MKESRPIIEWMVICFEIQVFDNFSFSLKKTAGFVAMIWGISKTRKEWEAQRYGTLEEETEIGILHTLDLSVVGKPLNQFAD